MFLEDHNGSTVRECASDFYNAGLQEGENVLSVTRVLCTLITVSIISSWFGRRKIGRLLLFFWHWLGGLVHLLSGTLLTQMLLNCWLEAGLLNFVKAVKFVELVTANMLAITNLAICVNLALIVHGHRTMTRVRSVSSPRLVSLFLLVAVVEAAAVAPFWDIWAISGTSFHPRGDTLGRNNWIAVSYFLFEAIASFFMTAIVALLLIFRRPELRQVWGLHRRIKYHFALTVIALVVNITITVAGVLTVVKGGALELVILSWVLRYVHVALDTLVLYSAIGTPTFKIESSFSSFDEV